MTIFVTISSVDSAKCYSSLHVRLIMEVAERGNQSCQMLTNKQIKKQAELPIIKDVMFLVEH